MTEDRNYALEARMAAQRVIEPEPKHHSAQQVREDDGRWRPEPGYAHADHARPVPVSTATLLPGGEQVPITSIAVQVDNRLVQANVADEIARVFALPAELIRSR